MTTTVLHAAPAVELEPWRNVIAYVSQSQSVESLRDACASTRRLLDTPPGAGSFQAMAERTVQLVLHYDGAGFSGWQRQPEQRTVQGVLENALERLCTTPIAALGSGRTDAGVHARGQAVGVRAPERWVAEKLRRALNAILPNDVWVAAAAEMKPEFHARFSAVTRRYSYTVGTDDAANSPFRNRFELALPRPVDRAALDAAASRLEGEHCFRAFAVSEGLDPDAVRRIGGRGDPQPGVRDRSESRPSSHGPIPRRYNDRNRHWPPAAGRPRSAARGLEQ